MLSNLSFAQMAIVISLSIIPSFILLFLILYSDRKNREPVPLIIISVISGLFTISLSLLIDKIFLKLNISNDILLSYNNYNIFKIIILASVEEFSKWFVLYIFLSHNSSYDDIYDGFVYSSIISLSFALTETIMYVFSETAFQDMTNLAILRNITSVPLHIVCGIIMGYNISLVKFSKYKKNKMFKLSKSLLIPIFVHSLYNLFFSILSFRNINNYISVVIMVLFIMGIYVLGCLYILETVVLNKIFMNNLIYDKDYDYLMTRQEFLMRRSNK